MIKIKHLVLESHTQLLSEATYGRFGHLTKPFLYKRTYTYIEKDLYINPKKIVSISVSLGVKDYGLRDSEIIYETINKNGDLYPGVQLSDQTTKEHTCYCIYMDVGGVQYYVKDIGNLIKERK